MEEKNDPTHFLFFYKSNYVRVSKREEKNFLNLLERYGSVKNVPSNELISVCRTQKIKETFTDSENYSFIPVNQLIALTEMLPEKRKTRFLKFNKGRVLEKSVK